MKWNNNLNKIADEMCAALMQYNEETKSFRTIIEDCNDKDHEGWKVKPPY